MKRQAPIPFRAGNANRAAMAACVWFLACGCSSFERNFGPAVPKWSRFEREFHSAIAYANPVQEARLWVTFTSPSGLTRAVEGFWDGGRTWRVRFQPNELGRWTYAARCTFASDYGLDLQSGKFLCTAPLKTSLLRTHGQVRVAQDGRHLEHEDGTPFFWLADTCWNGALMATQEDWDNYLVSRREQGFSAVQWVATQWRGAPDGDRDLRLAFTGSDRIAINPDFFRRLDRQADEVNAVGLLNCPVMLWAVNAGPDPKSNPGISLPDDQAVVLARYMVARWGANDVVWILAGDGDYRGGNAERWKRIGRAVFGDQPHAPVALHSGGQQWYLQDFRGEKWLDIVGYQTGHGDDDRALKWTWAGPAATDWATPPPRPFINLEPAYEDAPAYQSGQRFDSAAVRRATYWSLLVAPTAGVSYGANGVWGWNDGAKPTPGHPNAGTPLKWRDALQLPAGQQMGHAAALFRSLDFYRLCPAPSLIARQPGESDPRRFIAAAQTEAKDLALVYTPQDRSVELRADALPPSPKLEWFDPRSGERSSARGSVSDGVLRCQTPSDGDWMMLITGAR